jgi:LysM repeat protein
MAATRRDLFTATYEVQRGDTLLKIAKEFDTTLKKLLVHNPQIANPDLIRVGEQINVPNVDVPVAPVSVSKGDAEADSDRDAAQGAEHPRDVGGVVDWSRIDEGERNRYVVGLLLSYGYPVNAAAGIVGNLMAESGVIPNRIEGSSTKKPMRTKGFDGETRTWSADEVMNRFKDKRGPKRPGVGLAQWTSKKRRAGLFSHVFEGRELGSGVLFDMDAQVDYLVAELAKRYRSVDELLRDPEVLSMPQQTRWSTGLRYRAQYWERSLARRNGRSFHAMTPRSSESSSSGGNEPTGHSTTSSHRRFGALMESRMSTCGWVGRTGLGDSRQQLRAPPMRSSPGVSRETTGAVQRD